LKHIYKRRFPRHTTKYSAPTFRIINYARITGLFIKLNLLR